jgi:Holliday junction DNA helicase RuvA
MSMIAEIRGLLVALEEESAILEIDAFRYEVLVPDFSRRVMQLKLRQTVSLFTVHYIDGNPTKGGRMTPRLIGFVTEIERDFFDLFCSVDGVGVKKALRAMVRPVQDIAVAIEEQDVKTISSLPGIGAATAERIIAKLRRKMAKFALLVTQQAVAEQETATAPDVVAETHQILLTLGHSESEARRLLDQALVGRPKFKDVEALLQAVYDKNR